MKHTSSLLIWSVILLGITVLVPCPGWTQRGPLERAPSEKPEAERARDGIYEITLKTPDSRRIMVDELVRDREINSKALFRVRTGGYLSFDESDWVDKIEFKIFDIPITQIPQYKEFASILTDINTRIWDIKQMLDRYNQLSLRLMNICDKTMFPTLQSIDENIAQQLSIYQKLLLLRALIVNALDRFVRDRSCVDRYDQFKADLVIYTKRLTELCRDYDRLSRKALEAAQIAKPTPESARPPESNRDRKKWGAQD
jgi:hypothetical protein